MLPVNRFTAFIEQNNLFGYGSKVLAAVSGGMDSVIMARLLKAAGFNFGIAHCNFQLRGDEADADQSFCKHLAEELQVPFHTINFDTAGYATANKLSTQMAARDLRYQWFETIRQQHNYIAISLAHHQNDAIETILLNLTRGTGVAGLHGILPKNGVLIRPLLFLTRDEIQAIITDEQIAYVEDSSNASSKYARNKLRLEVIPKLKELNPSLEATFESNFRHLRQLELLLQNRVTELRDAIFIYADDEVHIAIAEIKKLLPQQLLLFNLLQDFGVNETLVNDLISVLDKHSGRVFETVAYNLLLDRDKLIISPKQNLQLSPVVINEGSNNISYGQFRLSILHDDGPLIIKDNPMAVSVDSEKLVYPLTLRQWRQGDQFYPLGMKGSKKLSDFFISEKIPLHTKTQIPLLVNGNNQIIWIAGQRLDDRYKVNDKTKKVTIFELLKRI